MPETYDAQIAVGTDVETILNNVFEGLIRIDSNGEIQKGVATDWTISDDGLTYTFTLRDDATWYVPSSADEVLGEDYESTFDTRLTANDFAFAIARVLDDATDAPQASKLSNVDEAYAEDDTTLIIKLKKPSESFLTVLALPICMPCNETFFNATAGRYGLSTGTILSNGPYYISYIDSESGAVTLKKNEDYHGDYVALSEKVKLAIQDEEDPVYYSIETMTKEQTKSLDETYTVDCYQNGVKALCFNSKCTALESLTIRQVLATATNVSLFADDTSTLANGLVPECCVLHAGEQYRSNIGKVSGPTYSVEEASKLFATVKQELKLTVTCLEEDKPTLQEVVQDWQKACGVSLSVSIETVETQDELDKLVNYGEYDIVYTRIDTLKFLALDYLDEYSKSGQNNIINLYSKEYGNLISAAYTAGTTEELKEALTKCETFLIEKCYFIPTINTETYIAKSETGKEITLRPSGSIISFYK